MKRVLIARECSYDGSYIVGTHQYAQFFLKDGWEVFWLGGPWNFAWLLGDLIKPPHHFHRSLQHIRSWQDGVKQIGLGFYSYSTFSLFDYRNLPIVKAPWFLKNLLKFTFPSLRQVLKKSDWHKVDLLWLSNLKTTLGIYEIINAECIVYHVTDDYNQFPSVPPSFYKLEEEFVRNRASIILAASHEVFKKMKVWNDNTYYLPNGVDISRFSKRLPSPDEYASIPRPRIIYVGALEHWFDLKLTYEVACNLKDYSFILIGHPRIDMHELDSLPNVYSLGRKDYDEVPKYLQHSDVGIIPFQINDLTHSISPIKLYEYFAAGLPVVSVRLKEVEHLNSPAYLACNPNEFSIYVQLAVANRKVEECYEFARINTWEARYIRLKEIRQNYLAL